MRRKIETLVGAATLTLALGTSASADLYCPQAANSDWWSDLDMIGLYECLQNGKTRGKEIDGVDESGYTILEHAIMNGANAPRIEAILEAGADPNRKGTSNDWQMTPLMFEAWAERAIKNHLTPRENLERAEALLEAGADPNAVDKYGWPAFSYQVGSKGPSDPVLIDRLLAAGATFTTPMPEPYDTNVLFSALSSGNDLEFLQRLQQVSGADLLAINSEGHTLLHMVRVEDTASAIDIVDFLLDAGVDPMHRAVDGRQAWEHMRNWSPELAAYTRRAGGIPLPGLPTSDEMEAVCRPVYASIGGREPGVSVDDVCTCVGQYGPAMYERISGAANFNKVYPAEMPRQARLQQLLNPLMTGCAILYTKKP